MLALAFLLMLTIIVAGVAMFPIAYLYLHLLKFFEKRISDDASAFASILIVVAIEFTVFGAVLFLAN